MAEPGDSLTAGRLADACLAAACLAVDPWGIGAVLRTPAGETGEHWIELLKSLLPQQESLRRVPAHVDDERLLGGTDLAATLSAGRAVFAPGVLVEADGHLLVLTMAERLRPHLAAGIGNALDRHGVSQLRAGGPALQPTRFGVIALDHGRDAEERCAAALRDRLALHLDLDGLRLEPTEAVAPERAAIMAARARLVQIEGDDAALRALCGTAAACGIDSLRAPLLALRVARAHAALEARSRLESEDLQFAARVVLAARATVNPTEQSATPPPPPEPPPPEPQPPAHPEAEPGPAEPPPAESDASTADRSNLEEQVLEAARAAIPAGLLAQLAEAQMARQKTTTAGRAGAVTPASGRGRPAGVRAGRPRRGTPLNIVATLRTAAPWQRLRRKAAPEDGAPRIRIHLSDFRVTCFRQRAQTVTVFALDASGSSALHRLAEAKGAVELLLAECYVRRDQVAVVVFRGKAAELALAPTRSLLRAKRSLASLPGGGATPLAAGIDAAYAVAEQALKRGQTPSVVLLTDGQANVARDGAGGRQRAQADALLAGRALRALGVRTLLIDTAPRAQPLARALAEALQARYLPLPNAEARSLAAAVQNAS